jgi:hypothetical protein
MLLLPGPYQRIGGQQVVIPATPAADSADDERR